MIRTPISSSNLNSIGYDSSKKTLEVEFASGQVYDYYDVPQGTYDGLMKATSHGHYFRTYIKNSFSADEV